MTSLDTLTYLPMSCGLGVQVGLGELCVPSAAPSRCPISAGDGEEVTAPGQIVHGQRRPRRFRAWRGGGMSVWRGRGTVASETSEWKVPGFSGLRFQRLTPQTTIEGTTVCAPPQPPQPADSEIEMYIHT